MLTQAIVLKNTKYSESSLVTTMFTEQHGMQTYMINGVRKTNKQGGTKANLLEVANILELESEYKSHKNLQYIKNFSALAIYSNNNTSIIKNCIRVFCCELYYCTLHAQFSGTGIHSDLFLFLKESLLFVEQHSLKQLSNFPIYFCLRFAYLLGYSFNGEFCAETPFLDLQEGSFIASPARQNAVLNAADSARLQQIMRCSIAELYTVVLQKNERYILLQHCLLFLKLHIPEMRELHSLQVLHEIFD